MAVDKVSKVRAVAAELHVLSDNQLADFGEALRHKFAESEKAKSDNTLLPAMALATECIRRTLGITLFDTQILAANALSEGKIAEMETGEGKTFAAAPAAIVGALSGYCVHVATTNAYLAERDFQLLKPVFELAGVTASLLPEQTADEEEKRTAYQCEVVYGTGYEFGFDYLRDSLKLRTSHQQPLGQSLITRLTGFDSFNKVLQNRLQRCIVDEADNVLIDEACSPLILSGQNDQSASDTDACNLAASVANSLEVEKHFRINGQNHVTLSDQGQQAVHLPTINIPVDQLRRPWVEYVHQALRALHLFKRDSHYVVMDRTIQIVDPSTGRIFVDRSWSDGLHQAVEAKEQVPITNERVALAQITRQKFYRLYENLGGMTGTAVGCGAELKEIYKTDVVRIPRRIPSRRKIYETKVFPDSESKWKSICKEAKKLHEARRPVLIGTRTIAESEMIGEVLTKSGLPFQLLNGRQDGEEAELISRAGRPGEIMIATNLAGRGTDIKLSQASRDAGGLHVIVSSPHDLYRIDRQLIGRSARQGDPGSARTYLSADDQLLTNHAPWLIKTIKKDSNRDGELGFDLTSEIRKIQQTVEKQQAFARSEMLKQDIARDKLLIGK